MHIRDATMDDATAIARVHVDAWRETYRGMLPDDYLDALRYADRANLWRRILGLGDPRSHVLLAIDETDQIVGFINGGAANGGDSVYAGEFYALYVLRAAQGRGSGRALLLASAARFGAVGIHSALAWVLAENQQARGFYARMGGQEHGEKHEHIGSTPIREVGYLWSDLAVLQGRS